MAAVTQEDIKYLQESGKIVKEVIKMLPNTPFELIITWDKECLPVIKLVKD